MNHEQRAKRRKKIRKYFHEQMEVCNYEITAIKETAKKFGLEAGTIKDYVRRYKYSQE